jgi:hypothetical protein
MIILSVIAFVLASVTMGLVLLVMRAYKHTDGEWRLARRQRARLRLLALALDRQCQESVRTARRDHEHSVLTLDPVPLLKRVLRKPR